MATDMIKEKISNHEIIAQEKRRYRAIFGLLASFVLLAILCILLSLAASAHPPFVWLANILAAALLLGWVAFAFIRIRPGLASPDQIFDEDYQRRTIDLQQRRWRILIPFQLLFLGALAWVATAEIATIHIQNIFPFLGATSFAFFAWTTALTVCFGYGFANPATRAALNDELTRTQRARSLQFGYILAIFEMCAILVAAMVNPRWAILAAPSAITAAIALPAIYFLILEWRADRLRDEG